MTGIEWVEAMDAAKHPVMHRTVLHNKGLSRAQMSGVQRVKSLALGEMAFPLSSGSNCRSAARTAVSLTQQS